MAVLQVLAWAPENGPLSLSSVGSYTQIAGTEEIRQEGYVSSALRWYLTVAGYSTTSAGVPHSFFVRARSVETNVVLATSGSINGFQPIYEIAFSNDFVAGDNHIVYEYIGGGATAVLYGVGIRGI